MMLSQGKSLVEWCRFKLFKVKELLEYAVTAVYLIII